MSDNRIEQYKTVILSHFNPGPGGYRLNAKAWIDTAALADAEQAELRAENAQLTATLERVRQACQRASYEDDRDVRIINVSAIESALNGPAPTDPEVTP